MGSQLAAQANLTCRNTKLTVRRLRKTRYSLELGRLDFSTTLRQLTSTQIKAPTMLKKSLRMARLLQTVPLRLETPKLMPPQESEGRKPQPPPRVKSRFEEAKFSVSRTKRRTMTVLQLQARESEPSSARIAPS